MRRVQKNNVSKRFLQLPRPENCNLGGAEYRLCPAYTRIHIRNGLCTFLCKGKMMSPRIKLNKEEISMRFGKSDFYKCVGLKLKVS